ncbi:hypothetical protein V6N00_08195 [Tersicoccus sp. MR15.9]|uniref:hypothetical protein n=1 Tax=Tersicoccus mangrovi TaxID=3121635 RepID=UPI002FE56F29
MSQNQSDRRPDAVEAQAQLAAARRAHQHAVWPRLTAGESAACAVTVGLGIAAMGQAPGSALGHLLALVVGVALCAAAAVLWRRFRVRRGLRGLDGAGRTQLTTFLVMVVVLMLGAVAATPANQVVYPILGLAAAVAYFFVLRAGRTRRVA